MVPRAPKTRRTLVEWGRSAMPDLVWQQVVGVGLDQVRGVNSSFSPVAIGQTRVEQAATDPGHQRAIESLVYLEVYGGAGGC